MIEIYQSGEKLKDNALKDLKMKLEKPTYASPSKGRLLTASLDSLEDAKDKDELNLKGL